jgi:hypothetical protein
MEVGSEIGPSNLRHDRFIAAPSQDQNLIPGVVELRAKRRFGLG